MAEDKRSIYVGDFETTVFDGQEYTEVWASALVKLGTEDVTVLGSIEDTFDYIHSLDEDVIIYYHNLKFDGSFWLDFLLVQKDFRQASVQFGEEYTDVSWVKGTKRMPVDSVMYAISLLGQWYKIVWKHKGHIIELRDSLKLLPFSVKEIGNAFATKHRKLDMEYKGFRYANCPISQKEQEYIKNDVLVVKEALEIMFDQGHKNLTIGSCALDEFKKIIGKKQYKNLFPNVYKMEIDETKYGSPTVGDYIHNAYKGGWCYVLPGKAHKILRYGVTADVNSLYPSVMHSESGCEYPYGEPLFWSGNYIPEEAQEKHRYFYIRIKTRFYLKKNYLPWVQIKNTLLYRGTECLESSDVWVPDPDDDTKGGYMAYYSDGGKVCDTRQTMTMTMVDYKLFLDHYIPVEFEILDGCFFPSMTGIFDDYIDKYREIKMNSKGAMRTLAKLFLNSLYGKTAASPDSSFKYAYLDPTDKIPKFLPVHEEKKQPGYLPIGAAITSYARNFTIRAAQKNYHGPDRRGFIYADTDSIHCDLPPELLKGVPLHPTAFCHWKLESQWDEAYFARQKTYIEHVVKEDGEEVEPHYVIKAAGMPQKCKDLFLKSMQGYEPGPYDEYTEEELEFLSEKRNLMNFDYGLSVPGKLMPKRIRGGIILVDTTFEMR